MAKSPVIQIRVQQELLDAISSEAAKSGRTPSEEARERLMRSLRASGHTIGQPPRNGGDRRSENILEKS